MRHRWLRSLSRHVLLLTLSVPTWSVVAAPAAAGTSPYAASEVKAAFLHRFAGYIEWPAAEMEAPRFVIAVLGADAVASSLERALTDLSVKGKPAEVRRILDIRAARQAHIVYIGRDHAAELPTLLPQLARRPILIVTDADRGLEAGGMLNFRIGERRVRFEVALDTAEHAGLEISADLLSVALNVRRHDLRSDELCLPRPIYAPWHPCAGGLLTQRRWHGRPLPCPYACDGIDRGDSGCRQPLWSQLG